MRNDVIKKTRMSSRPVKAMLHFLTLWAFPGLHALVPISSIRHPAIRHPGVNMLSKKGTPGEEVLSKETVVLDEATVKVAAAAASELRQQRIDAALAELARTGDQTSAAAAGGFMQPFEDPSHEPPPAWLSVAPAVIGSFSIVLFVLNEYGVFGTGPDLTNL